MRLKQFLRLIDIHGADPARWPAAERAQALQRAATDPAAQRALDEARRLAALLARAPAPPSGDAGRRVAAALARLPAQQSPYWWPAPIALWDLLPRWPRTVALATMAALGILVGLTDLGGAPAPASSADLSALIFDPNPQIGLGQ
ncbi:MAG TPA: hypothetical protein VMB81_28700 [Candidatus Sulfotelmatobacter sp.]|nr:hypothetical protein [Candidatus Sulfotelmatobacter sp.]